MYDEDAVAAYDNLQSARTELARLESLQTEAQAQESAMANAKSTKGPVIRKRNTRDKWDLDDDDEIADASGIKPEVAAAQPGQQQSAPESVAPVALQTAAVAQPSKPQAVSERVRDIDPSRETNNKPVDLGPMLQLLGQVLTAIQSGNEKIANAINNIQMPGAQPGMDYSSINQAIARG